MKIISRWEAQLKVWVREHGHFILINLIFGVLVYFTMMSEGLVNSNDGLLYTSYYNAGGVEASSGRGMLYYLDHVRAGVVSVPLNSILTVLIISITGVVILDIFSVTNKAMGFVMTMILIANPVTCATLSYCYTSVNYGVAFLFSVLAAYCVCRCHKTLAVLAGGVFLAFSMGCYQAYFSVTCLLILMFLIQKLLRNENGRDIANFLVRSVFAIVTGGVFYFIFTKLMLLKFNTEISNYKGASDVSLKTIILNLPKSIPQCYKNYYDYFRNKMALTSSRTIYLLLLIGIVSIIGFCVIYQFCTLLRKNWRYALFFLAAVCLIPIASSAITIIVLGGNSRLISMGFLVSIVMIVVFVPWEGKISFFAKRGYFVLMLFLLWINALSVTNEQLALKEGKRASVTIAQSVLNELIAEDYLEEGYVIALIGKPPASDLFARRAAWGKVFGDTRFADGWHNRREFWRQIYIEYCGVQLNYCDTQKYNTLMNSVEVAAMPCFPAEGSIAIIDGVTVVKIADSY